MRVRAPGKVVLSGAYAVLRGAPALVTAVSRYVVADASRPADFITPEVTEALGALQGAQPPWFDASALRERGQKLGLGSSAAILVASLGALAPPTPTDETIAWQTRLYERALTAHRAAQGGGSGVDVAAASFGGTFLARLDEHAEERSASRAPLLRTPAALPPGLHLELWAMGTPASTADFVRAVFCLEQRDPRRFEHLLGAQQTAAHLAAEAVRAGDAVTLVQTLRAQRIALAELGDAAGVPIVLDALRALEQTVQPEAAVLPAGAGGGDISIYAGPEPSSDAFRSRAASFGMWPIEAALGAPGAHLAAPPPT